jgi:hypothetical protein
MGKPKRPFGGRGCGLARKRKAGTNNREQAAKRDERAAAAAEAAAHLEPQSPVDHELEEEPETRQKRRYRHTSLREEALKRAAIEFMYVQLGSPPEALWKGYHGTVATICRMLRLPTGKAGVCGHVRAGSRRPEALRDWHSQGAVPHHGASVAGRPNFRTHCTGYSALPEGARSDS